MLYLNDTHPTHTDTQSTPENKNVTTCVLVHYLPPAVPSAIARPYTAVQLISTCSAVADNEDVRKGWIFHHDVSL